MTPRAAKEFKARWKAVAEQQLKEFRRLTVRQRVEMTLQLMEWARFFEKRKDSGPTAEDLAVQDRWRRLRSRKSA